MADKAKDETQDDAFQLRLSVDDLTIDEVVEVEERVGRSVESMLDDNVPKGKLVKALVWLQMRHSAPDSDIEVLWGEAGKIKLKQIKRDETVSPTDASV